MFGPRPVAVVSVQRLHPLGLTPTPRLTQLGRTSCRTLRLWSSLRLSVQKADSTIQRHSGPRHFGFSLLRGASSAYRASTHAPSSTAFAIDSDDLCVCFHFLRFPACVACSRNRRCWTVQQITIEVDVVAEQDLRCLRRLSKIIFLKFSRTARFAFSAREFPVCNTSLMNSPPPSERIFRGQPKIPTVRSASIVKSCPQAQLRTCCFDNLREAVSRGQWTSQQTVCLQ